MSFAEIYQIAGAGMNAQTIRLNTVASNLANAGAAAETPDQAFRALKPVFSTIYQQTQAGQVAGAHVEVAAIVQSDAPLDLRYEPDHPYADEQGYVAYSNVNTVEEMADMMAASRSFETNVEIMNRARSMQQGLLQLGAK
ncbi:flagellar basal body rod protein FlgC [Shewanella fidelis]|uniref:Flagellar basal-body rod protein FlgC n=1 Tax=Shewanella fidelis TaxID=173509 RepID=A0AAW8NUG5_9GAMM|nr:flagellar basal body rod protein FlgC [Shewanella fidelis]MDR8525920.1 flagellar basal body rod protein FlgC [Shewanella fidelis]MDW4813892.1 flagellar basal body rod protein FlgC [Shewanella fidelis]MDW4817916.1 flagellar basal body rod protein FlgC [Shewanella fidelis]MDW4821983.1 flagellar basal body rod protein FlgC [Shewanella fidelis]MDW4826148.1 flagellar basal body rod protein FlgC [Shewanella fidelis]